jgi:enoyl-CoA hydratase
MELTHVLLEKKNRIATVTLNRPEGLNALNAQTITDLECAFYDAAQDKDVAVVVITGAGEKAFAAGADIAELSQNSAWSGALMAEKGQRVLRFLETMGKPSIAAVNGFALGGGCEIAMACTVRIASEKAKLGQPEVNLGLIPGYAGTQRLSRLVGKGIALDLIISGRIIDAAEAYRIGLVTQVVPPETLMDAVDKYAQNLMQKGPLALKAAIEAVDRGFDLSFGEACLLEKALFGTLSGTEDMKEGTGAFLEKRKAEFKGK